jgi:sugar lactone lactonase YvrE
MEAHKNKDYPLFLDSMAKLNTYLPENPTVLYNLASAYSLNKNKDESLKYLKKMMTINANPAISDDSDFDFIKDSDEFKAVLKKIKQMNKHLSGSEPVFTIKERDLHPESVVYDTKTGFFYIGSVHKRKIVQFNSNGSSSDFTYQGQDGLYGVMGMRIDPVNRVLWVASSGLKFIVNFNSETEDGVSGVFKYNLDTKKLLKKYILKDDEKHNFDDLILHSNGDIYISDSKKVYRITKAKDELEQFIDKDDFVSVQGLCLVDNEKKLLIADWIKGMFIYDFNSQTISKIEHDDNISLKGIDGIYPYENISIVAIQNGIKPMRVARYYFDDSFSRIIKTEILESGNPIFNEPTLGTIVKNVFYYVANSQWNGYNRDGSIQQIDKLSDTHILKIDLAK